MLRMVDPHVEQASALVPRMLPRRLLQQVQELAAESGTTTFEVLADAVSEYTEAGSPPVLIPATVATVAATLDPGIESAVLDAFSATAWWLGVHTRVCIEQLPRSELV